MSLGLKSQSDIKQAPAATLSNHLVASTVGRFTMEKLMYKVYHAPRQTLNLPEPNKTFVDVELDHFGHLWM